MRTTSAGLVNLAEGADGGIGCLVGIVVVMAVLLIIKRARVVMATPEGRAVRLTGPTRVGVSRRRLQAGGAADLDRIWAWAVARGYTRETGRYTELHGPRKRLQLQLQRREQERRHGLI